MKSSNLQYLENKMKDMHALKMNNILKKKQKKPIDSRALNMI